MQRQWRTLELDGQALLFDRLTGTNVLIENERTKSLRRKAPRLLQVALTNACDKACSFCYRSLDAASRFTFDDVVELAKFCDEWGVLELAFGGGEPTLFPRFAELLRAIWSQTGLCASFTTNGLRLRQSGLLRELRGAYGQVQLSVYDEDDTLGLIDHLVEERARFGLNYLVTPARVRSLEADVFTFLGRGARDILFLSYKGPDSSLHLSADECRRFDDSLLSLHERLGTQIALKVDVCWAGRLQRAPQLLNQSDCEANVDFLSVSSDRKVLSCSFAHGGIPFASWPELRSIYVGLQGQRLAAQSAGCARLPHFGLGER
jgi:MoaA/NifB/PqqE/SkfB family radical SAM enzyme